MTRATAVLLAGSSLEHIGAQDWYFPSRAECMRCHTDRAGRSLGLELGQLNGDFLYASTNRISNQLATLEHIGLFAAPLPGSPQDLPVIPSPLGTTTPVEGRARAYLHANCSMCHRLPGEGRALLDLRFSTDLKSTQTCNMSPAAGTLGLTNGKLLTPGDPMLSLLSVRSHATDAWRMPPLTSSVIDKDGLAVVDTWIKALTTCPP